MRGFSATATSPRWKKIGKTNAGRKMPSVIASAAGEPAGEVADEGREDDQRRRQHAADRQPVDELALGEPALAVDRALLEERDHGEGAAEGEQPGLQPLEEDLRRQRDRDRAGERRPRSRAGASENELARPSQRPALVHSS